MPEDALPQDRAPTAASPWPTLLLAAALGLAVFALQLDPGLVLSGDAYWRNPKNDMTAMIGGYEAWLRAPWTWPPTVVDTLAEQPVSIVFTDSIPWLALLLKATGLGQLFNPLGLFLLLSYPLQAVAMACLLRALGVQGRAPLLLGAGLALLFPPWLARQYGHIALTAHWILLFTLALAVAAARFGLTWRRIGLFALLAGLATGVHAYHLVPVAAGFAAALLSELLQRRPGAVLRVFVGGAFVLMVVLGCAAALGYGVGRGPTGGADALGVYAMNLLGPVLPSGSQLFGQVWTGSWFTRVVDPTGAQGFEGLQYLGAGGLLLVALAAAAGAARLAAGAPGREAVLRWAPFWLATAALYAWAVGWNVYLGPVHVAQLPRPSGLAADVIGGFRAHGRFFWLGGYLLVALGVLWASRLRPRTGLAVLGLAVALQAWEMAPMRQGLRETYSSAPPLYPAGLADDPALKGRPWVFAPTYFCSPSPSDQRAIAELALLAVRLDGTLNTFPTARSVDPACGADPPGLGDDAAAGDRRIVVVTSNGRSEGGALQAVAWRSDCHRWSHGVMCGRDLSGVDGLIPAAPGELHGSAKREVLRLRLDQPPRPAALTRGWAQMDPGGKAVWSLGRQAALRLQPPAAAIDGSPLILELTAIGFSDAPLRPQRARVFISGRPAGVLQVDPRDFATFRLAVPPEVLVPGQPLDVVFDLPDARSSRADPRVLGIALQSVAILKATPPDGQASEAAAARSAARVGGEGRRLGGDG